MPLVVIGLSHHASPVSVRERFAFADDVVPDALEKLRAAGLAREAVILSTCNRVEIYAAGDLPEDQAIPGLWRFLLDFHKSQKPPDGQIYARGGQPALEHLFKVACGLDSMVPGETEVLGQLKKAYDAALRLKHTGAILNKAFQMSFHVAKQVRTETNIQRGNVSVSSVAVDLAEKIFTSLADHPVMVIGAGETSEKTARALLSRGAKSILVSNRSHVRAVELARELGGRAVSFDDWAAESPNMDIIISSTSAPHFILDRASLAPLMKARKNRPLLLIDMAVPRDIDPSVQFLENVYLYNMDDLQTIAADSLRRRRLEIARCEAIIAEKAGAMMAADGLHFHGMGEAGA